MPLPKPPAKRADFLSRSDFESPSPHRNGKHGGRARQAADPAAASLLELSNEGTLPAAPPVAAKPAPDAALAAARTPAPRERAKKPRGDGPATLFVLDTNVLMHDPTSLFRFDEHDIYLPMITLEELDSHKRGMTEVARNARQVSRDLDALAADLPRRDGSGRTEGIPLNGTGHREAGGKLFFQTDLIHVSLPQGLPQGKADNQILGVVKALVEQSPERNVVLVSKDINMRIKARALGLPAEDYFNDKTLDFKVYSEIIMTRVTVPVGEDIGFLPGTEEEKMTPWMGALEDNLDVLMRTDDEAGDWGRAATADLIRNRIKVKSLNFMRGRTFINKYLIIDEAQNLTPKQMKTLITRAGPGTKVVCLGNIAQIDTPYLTEGSSGLTYVVDRFKGWNHSGHVTLMRGERSRLADHAAEVL